MSLESFRQKIKQAKQDAIQSVKETEMQKNLKRNAYEINAPLALWNSLCCTAIEEFVPNNTGKAHGQMKNWITELRKSDYTEDEIKALLKKIVSNWNTVAKAGIVDKYGNEKKAPRLPLLDFVYSHRYEIISRFSVKEQKIKREELVCDGF